MVDAEAVVVADLAKVAAVAMVDAATADVVVDLKKKKLKLVVVEAVAVATNQQLIYF